MKLYIFDNNGKTIDRYTVVINNDVYTMSTNCNMLDGVNMYSHTVENIKEYIAGMYKDNMEITHYALSQTVLNCIVDRMLSY